MKTSARVAPHVTWLITLGRWGIDHRLSGTLQNREVRKMGLNQSVSPSLPLSCVTAFHHVSSGVYDDFKVTNWKGFGNERSRPNKTHVIIII